MTKKDIFKIIIKSFGLYVLLEVIAQVPGIGIMLSENIAFEHYSFLAVIVVFQLILSLFLLFKSAFLVDLLHLNKGFDNDETLSNALDGKGITKIALILISLYLIVNNLGRCITQILFSFKESVSRNTVEGPFETLSPPPVDYPTIITTTINLLVGFILLTNHTRISNWIENLNKKNAGKPEL